MGNCLPFLYRCGAGDEEDDTAPLQHRRSTSSFASSASTSHETTSVANSAPPPYSHDQNVYYPMQREQGIPATPAVSEEEQLRLARRLGLLQELPTDTFVEGGKGDVECAICMVDLKDGDPIRFLPCLHSYHVDCVDDWLMRSFTCPSCMEPVDSALLSSYTTHNVNDLAGLSSSPACAGPTVPPPQPRPPSTFQ
uniref:RING-type domain-containing protein n=1 Tax=Plectus sambesii TaxID=2011161 RepID=A0A914UVI8_9BILA